MLRWFYARCLLFLSLSLYYLSPTTMINRDTRLAPPFACCSPLRRCFRGSAATYRQEKNDCHFMGTRWHCGIYRRWAVAGVARRGVWAENAKHIKCAALLRRECKSSARYILYIYIIYNIFIFFHILFVFINSLESRLYRADVIRQSRVNTRAVKYLWSV